VSSRRTQEQRAADFAALHAGDPFLILNPCDAGTARTLAGLGFKALATTSSGFAYTLGRRDGEVSLDDVTAHIEAISAATDLPLNADLESGFGPAPEDAARAITRAAEAGAVGGSIEDYDPDADALYDRAQAIEKIAAAREAADALDFPFMLCARSEGGFRGDLDVEETVARLQAFEEAGADVVYAPGLHDMEQVRAIAAGVTKPLNVLARPHFTFDELAEAGAQRVSVGGSLTWSALEATVAAAEAIRDRGEPTALRDWPA
jgi:2-methylisocitrate lyase-like PEP mutase family enzyme